MSFLYTTEKKYHNVSQYTVVTLYLLIQYRGPKKNGKIKEINIS
jgi:hypothetical protein